jgi:hypothetical protein
MNFAAVAAEKAERKAALYEALTATRAEETSARDRLEQLLDADSLAELDRRVLALVSGEGELEPEPALLEVLATAKDARRQTLVDAVLGRRE